MGTTMTAKAIAEQEKQGQIPLPPQEIIRQSIALAARSHQAGQLRQAEQLYRAILAVDPLHADALHGMGVLAHQAVRSDLAEQFLRAALNQRAEPTFHNNLGLVLLALDRPHEALAAVYRALELRGVYPEAFNALGNVQQKLGRRDEAAASYGKAVALRPDYADAHANLGKVLLEMGEFAAAEESARKASALAPASAEAWNILGNVLRARGEYDEAISCFDLALAARPHYAEAFNNRGVALLMLGKVDDAVVAARCALATNDKLSVAWATYGSALFAQGRFDEAVQNFERAVALDPNCLEAYNNLGTTLLQLDRADDAIAAFEKAIALSEEGSRAEGHYNLGTTLIDGNNLDRAIYCLGKAVEQDPEHAAAHNNLGVALQNKGLPDEAIESYGRGIEVDPQYAGAYCNKLMAMHYVESFGNDELLETARQFGRMFNRPDPRPFPDCDLAPDRRLRIGYVSGDFNNHPVGFFFARALAAHDRAGFETFCYSNWAAEDEMTAELRGLAGHWRDIHKQSDGEAFERISEDKIDILVDLSGHTNKTRLLLFGLKPAPIQASWIGYFGTTGLPAMDYLILDQISAPPGSDRWYTESVVRLPYGRFCYKPPAFDIALAEPPCLRKGVVTFGCFNNVAKLSAGAIRLWAEILRAAPDSRLLLKWKSLSEASVRERLLDSFAGHGVARDRIGFRGQSSYALMLREYNDIDIALDPFPFGGATTSCEALWMGVPVITLPGDRLASRQTLGFLHHMGHEELAADSPRDYVARAVALAKDPVRLKELRAGLRSAMESAPFCDGPKFTASLEAAYRQMWRRHVAGERPAAFDIAALG
ncbi:tetratricopeptide repeat protein [Rhodoblastus acidophilus]|uniref:protein O-GlcNAc transferase n=1 Tax=Candidatus Rhodoblastus alkanivorans TaxID=2954117 RepID=A0ABS9Z4C5_9HYPH|nr:tetratricopeptide repeat protein [Candidatus Rhodoblastus alkanivorans]MCI4678831.1 tetratricopeptide repeat protein [Candidatus Rhodoblastus alkanivorans]MCI4682220.1 tetratricopeptide repeat protein [Candidatus Rhodoblastus alkanivorans]MDI4639522.1 tetratricopeptide repeat protein [Rhodoblastus acidophilus]